MATLTMAGERRPARYAHTDGHTDVIYADSKLLTCGHDGDIRVWCDLEDDDPQNVCVGEWALSIAIRGNRLYVSTDNNAVQTYTYPEFEKDGIVTRFTAPITQIVVSDKLPGLICCSENMEARICTYENDSWTVKSLNHQGPVLSVAICPTAKYCMTACGDGVYRVWNVEDSTLAHEITSTIKANSFYTAKVLGRMSFEPITGKYLAYPNNKEIVVLDTKTWQKKISLTHSDIKTALSICSFSPCGNYLAANSITGQIAIWNVNENKCLGITEHPTSSNICSMSWNPSVSGELAFCDVTGQLATIVNCFSNLDEVPDDENLDLIHIIEREQEAGDDNSEYPMDSDGDDDENTISLRKLKKETGFGGETVDVASVRSRSRSRSKSRSRSRERAPMLATLQVPFQPSATPAYLEHRFMCWNDIGIVRCHTVDEKSNIEVEFHDTSIHHGIHMNNHLNHTMASLSSTVLALACEAPSKLVCIALVGGSKEWSVSLNDLEEIICLLATDTFVAVATSNRLIRIYTPLGTQLHVISLQGTPVCLAGRGGVLHVYYHSAHTGINDQHISMDIINIKGINVKCVKSGVHVALSNTVLLRWCGSSIKGMPITLDSHGMMRMFDPAANLWIPICDTSSHFKGVSDSFYIISVNEANQNIVAVLCRGMSYPLTAPRPIPTQLPIRLPFCEVDTEKGQLEEQLRRAMIFEAGKESQTIKEVPVKLFALATRSEIEQRATELVELLHDPEFVNLAVRYVTRLGKVHLAEKISNISESWKDEEPESDIMDEPMETHNLSDDANESMVLPSPVKPVEDVDLRPIPLSRLSQGSRNPFRRSLNDSNLNKSNNPLSLTDRSLINEDDSTAKKIISDPNPDENFPQWFQRNKAVLEEENDNLTPMELSKMAIQKFKALKSKVKESLTPKRKLNDTNGSNDENLPAPSPKQSKLSSFAFQKRAD